VIDRDETLASWRADRSFGWLLLLPELDGLDILCLPGDEMLARAMVMAGARVLLLRETGSREEAVVGFPGLRTTTLDRLKQDPAGHWREPEFDGLVCHDPAAQRLHAASRIDFLGLLEAVLPLLRPDAFVYLGLRNAWSPASRGLDIPPARTGSLVRLLRKAGFNRTSRHPYLLQKERVSEVLPTRGYTSIKNRELLRERLKEHLFGRIGARLIAPAYGLVMSRGGIIPSALQTLLSRLARFTGATPVLKSFLVFAGHKAILAVGPEDSEDTDLIVIVADDAMTQERRRAESDHLDALAMLPAQIASRVPHRVGEFYLGAARCVVISRVPGLTLDVACESLEPLTDAALSFLLDLSSASVRSVDLLAGGYSYLFAPLLTDACERNPWMSDTLREVDQAVRRIVMSQRLPVVWFHGDYKIENVMYEPEPVRLTGVIDWEHASPEGLPLLDLLYLLVYNRGIRGQSWIDASRSLLLGEPTQIEQARLDSYLQRVPIDASLRLPLGVMFVVHHIGRRIFLADDAGLRSDVAALLRDLAAALKRCTPTVGMSL
jgi:hypothetical protein